MSTTLVFLGAPVLSWTQIAPGPGVPSPTVPTPGVPPPPAPPVVPPSAAAAAAAKAEQDVLKAERDRFTAMIKADAGDLDKLLAPELVYTHSNAQLQDKAGFIADIRSGKIKYISIDPSDTHAQVFENTALVTGGAVIHVLENGNDFTVKVRYTTVYMNRRGGWQLVAWQATGVPQ
ncbi:MAG: nuclear transport factor 2 family protein [Planctomycetia bacterium]|nr:nuclear transport factor 2 family protein [Planctomycetia bacterium]